MEHFPQPLTWIDHVMTGIKLLDVNPTSPQLSAVLAGPDRAKRLAEEAVPTLERKPGGNNNPQGSNQHTKKESGQRNHDYVDQSKARGTNPNYLAQRIAESSPETHAAMKRGEFPSVRAAAVAAGVVNLERHLIV